MSGRQILRALVWIGAFALVAFAFLWAVFAVQSSRAHRAGEKALAAGDESAAQAYFERSIRSHCPFNTWGKRSAARLQTMAEGYERNGQIERAISAYESLMTSLAAIDTGWSRLRRERIEQLEQRILALRRGAKAAKAEPAK